MAVITSDSKESQCFMMGRSKREYEDGSYYLRSARENQVPPRTVLRASIIHTTHRYIND